MSEQLKTGVEISVTITALASGGSCVGTITEPTDHAGKKAFVPLTIPGETVTARITKNKKSFVEAELVQIAHGSPERVTPSCPVFGVCGGCDLQHINLPSQRRLKAEMVADLLRIHGEIVPREGVSILGADLPSLYYRRRMSFHINKKREFGLYRKNGRQIVEITHCPISTHTINDFLKENVELIKGCAPEVETVTVEDHDGTIHLAFEVHPRNHNALETLLPKDEFKELERRWPNLQVNFRHKAIYRTTQQDADGPPVGHFSQNNRDANQLMLDRILSLVESESVTDLYAGAGNISLPLAQAGHTVTAVEVDPFLVRFGESKAKAAGLSSKVTFQRLSCEKWAEGNTPAPTVVLDPPRGGALEVCQRLSPLTSPRLIYISCYPPTFARDVQVLNERGYELHFVEVLDMFPQTYHSELVALLSARA
jgi:23S rRNA (uracil1939-C5)-methyltransferase